MSPSRSSFQPTRLPPSFDPHHTSSRYPASHHTPYSPYRPGEYGRSERGGIASERTKIERKLFDDDDIPMRKSGGKDRDELSVPKPKEGSSPLAPAFEAKMVLRNGASVDLISWYVVSYLSDLCSELFNANTIIRTGCGQISIIYRNNNIIQ